MKAQQTIKWKTQVVAINKIKPTPNNFKLKTETGLAMFRTSVKNYGRAGVVILNMDYTLIDGNTRWEDAKEAGDKTIEASLPNRMLTPKEFKEFSAMFDYARAGEVDINRIKEELGTTAAFFKKWNIDIPMSAEKKLEELAQADVNIKPSEKRKQEETKANLIRPITLLFKPDESATYISIAESLYTKYKVDNITDLSMKLMLQAKKLK